MPIKYSNSKTHLKIEWTSPDETQTASFQIPKTASDETQVKALLKALAFLGAQTGVVPPAPTAATVTPSVTTPVKTAESAAVPPGPSTGSRIQMMSPAALSDLPAGGPPPPDATFWESMPTTNIPAPLSGGPMGWEMIPEGER